jgi:hypothetical protein
LHEFMAIKKLKLRKNAEAIIRTHFRLCEKRWIGRRI